MPFTCDICRTRFDNRGALGTHKKFKHRLRRKRSISPSNPFFSWFKSGPAKSSDAIKSAKNDNFSATSLRIFGLKNQIRGPSDVKTIPNMSQVIQKTISNDPDHVLDLNKRYMG